MEREREELDKAIKRLTKHLSSSAVENVVVIVVVVLSGQNLPSFIYMWSSSGPRGPPAESTGTVEEKIADFD